jgi:hypothetical protein
MMYIGTGTDSFIVPGGTEVRLGEPLIVFGCGLCIPSVAKQAAEKARFMEKSTKCIPQRLKPTSILRH